MAGEVVVGVVAAPHGLKGRVRIHPLTDHPERFFGMDRLLLSPRNGVPREYALVSAEPADRGILVELEGIGDRDQAETLRGAQVLVAPENRVELQEGEYWIDDIIGMSVVEEESGRPLGIVEDVLRTGANDCYVVRTPEGMLKYLPAIRDVVRSIDPKGKVLRATLIEGLWD
jgi:16S rRNA processing protein RimM